MNKTIGNLKNRLSGGKRDDSKARPPQNQDNAKEGGKKQQTQRRDADPSKNQQPPKASATRQQTGAKSNQKTSQSALSPGNNSGLQKQKENPLVQFGPILKEFLGSKELVNKSVMVNYVQNLDKFDIALTFQEVLPNGVSTAAPRCLTIAKYLEERNNLLKKKDPASSFKDFVGTLLDRVGVDLTQAKPNVDFRSVERFVMKHLSPVEREIVKLKPDEYDRIDTRKIPDMMHPTVQVIADHYGSFEGRTEFMLSQINCDSPTPDMEPPNWVLKGVPGFSKAVLLDALKIQHVPKITPEQQNLIDGMKSYLFNFDDEESKAPEVGQKSTAKAAGTNVGETIT